MLVSFRRLFGQTLAVSSPNNTINVFLLIIYTPNHILIRLNMQVNYNSQETALLSHLLEDPFFWN